MRYDVKKFLFVGVSAERNRFFEKAQQLGIVHFVEMKSKAKEIPADVRDTMTAIKVVRGLPPTDQEDVEDVSMADEMIQTILALKQRKEKLAEEERVTRLDIARVEVFGDFSPQDIASLEKETARKVQYYFTKEGYAEHNPVPNELIYVGRESGLDYFMGLNKEPKQYPKMVEMFVPQSVGQLKARLKDIDQEIHQKEQLLKSYAKYNNFLHHVLLHKLNFYNLHTAQEDVKWEMDNALFAIEGWVPINKVAALHTLSESLNVHMEEIAFNPTDTPPTVLENSGVARLGEDLVNIYDTPAYSDQDPSLWVLVFFAFFFAFIVGDGGYGLIFLAAALFVKYKYTLGKTWTRVVNLVVLLGFACICWGLLTTSFFGINIGIDNPLRKVSIINWMVKKKAAYLIQQKDAEWKSWVKKFPQLATVTDPEEFVRKGTELSPNGQIVKGIFPSFADNIMFELAIFIGVVHLIVSMLRYLRRNWTFLGWIIFLIGAYLYFSVFLEVNSIVHFIFGAEREAGFRDGLYLMIGGITIATVIGLVKNKLLGLLEPMTVIQLFGDSMSYLRLYALGLSGSMLTSTMMDLAGSVNVVFGIVILLIGHTVNIILSIMGGTIHGLRLNFLESYHYSFEGGGKPFKPLRKLTID